MRPLPSFLLLCASYGGTAIAYDFSTGKNGLDYCIAEADTTSDMTASTTMAAPTCTLPWTSLAPYMSATTWAPGVCEHNPMRDEGSEQCTRPASLSPSESTICFDDPFFDFFLAICRLQTRTSEDTCASTHTTSQAMEHALQSAPEASSTHCGQSEFSALWPDQAARRLSCPLNLFVPRAPHSGQEGLFPGIHTIFL